MRPLRLLWIPLIASFACVEPQYPGSEVIGTFDFTAGTSVAPTSELPACGFAELPQESFRFSGTFSQNPSGPIFFTLGGFDRDASFDGQVMTTTAQAPRQFGACECTDVTVEETIRVALLSRSQRNALSSPTCPANPFSGGVPAPNGDSITPPGPTDTGYDAVLACGELVDRVIPDPARCACGECEVRYPISGDRR